MKTLASAFIMLLLSFSLSSGVTSPAQSAATAVGSPEDVKAIEALVHSNPSDHVTEDVSFTNIFGTVRFGREEFIQRHKTSARRSAREQLRKAPSPGSASSGPMLPLSTSLEI